MALTVWISAERMIEVASGQQLVFGRDAGDATIGGDDPRVSRRHGILHAHPDHWTVRSIGSSCGLVLYDHETPSRLHIPRGIGPVTIPFARASLVIEARERRHAMTVAGAGAPGWAGSWASIRAEPSVPSGPGATRLPWDGVRWNVERTGRPQRWFQVLVAMCEPYFWDPPVEAVPTDAELAERLGTTVNVLRSRLVGEVRDALGFDTFTPHLRQTMVAVALAQQLVTAADLAVLDLS